MSDGPDYKAFSQWAIREGAWEGSDLPGDAIQQKAVEFAIIKEVKYDPDVHGPGDFDCEPGDPWFVFTESPNG